MAKNMFRKKHIGLAVLRAIGRGLADALGALTAISLGVVGRHTWAAYAALRSRARLMLVRAVDGCGVKLLGHRHWAGRRPCRRAAV